MEGPRRPALSIWAALALVASFGGCTQFPDLDDSLGDGLAAAEYPDLATADQLVGLTAADPDRGAREAQALQARVAGLQARADALRGGVLDQDTRRRMEQGVDTE